MKFPVILAALAALFCPQKGTALVVRHSPDTLNVVDASLLRHVGCFPNPHGLPSSCVYIGNGQILAAWHGFRARATDEVYLDGKIFRIDGARVRRLSNPPGRGLGVESDIVMVGLKTSPDLPRLKLAERAPFVGERVVFMGYGMRRKGQDPIYWQVGKRLIPTDREHAEMVGYSTTCSANDYKDGPVWGENHVERTGIPLRFDQNDGSVVGFYTLFHYDALPLEAQVGPGDSGGAAFVKRGNYWQLAGILHAESRGHLPQVEIPSNVAVFGTASYASDLSKYRSQILNPPPFDDPGMPAPRYLALMVLGCLIVFLPRGWLRTRRRAAA